MIKNPLYEEPRSQRTPVIRLRSGFSLVEWLESNGRMVRRDTQETDYLDAEEEISALIDIEDATYDIDDDEDGELDD